MREIALRHQSVVEVHTREGTIPTRTGKWIRVNAELENLTLTLDNLKMGAAPAQPYSKQMTITAGTQVARMTGNNGRPHCLALSDFNAASGKKRIIDCLSEEALEKWYDILKRVATTDLHTLLEPLREAREKERDAAELEEALAARPARIDAALKALRRGRLSADFVARDASERGVTALLAAARAARDDVVQAVLDLGALSDGPHHRSSLFGEQKISPSNANLGIRGGRRSMGDRGDEQILIRVEETPLLGAVRNDSYKACLTLLEWGADPTLQDDSRETPLLAAARLGGAKITAALLRSIATLAAQTSDERIRQQLLAHPNEEFGMDPSSALVAAAAAGHNGVVAALANGARASSKRVQSFNRGRMTTAATSDDEDENNNDRRESLPMVENRASEITGFSGSTRKHTVICSANVDRRDARGRTALHHAAERGRASVISPLADAGANIDALDGEGKTPIQLAASEGQVSTIAALLQRDASAPLSVGDADSRAAELVKVTAELRCALGAAEFDAARAGDLAIKVRTVLRAAALESSELSSNKVNNTAIQTNDPDHDDDDDDDRHSNHRDPSARLFARSTTNSALNNFPADICALPPSRQLTGLLRCCMNGDGQGVELWLKIGADANHADHGPDRITPLMACAIRGDRHLAKMLLATGRCEVDARDANGATALCRAALAAARSRTIPVSAASARDVAELLLQHGANPLRRDHNDRSPLSIAAADARDFQLVELIMRLDKNNGNSIDTDTEISRKGPDVDAPHTKFGSTPLMMAAAMPNATAVLRTLLGAHDLAADASLKKRKEHIMYRTADLRKLDKRGRTALFYAAEADRAENVELLLQFGRRTSSAIDGPPLDLDAKDLNGQTALQVATAAHAKGAVGALLRFGASASSTLALDRGIDLVQSKVYSTDISDNGEEETVRDLDDIVTQYQTDQSTQRPLNMAIHSGDAQIAGTLGRFRAAIVAGDDAATLRYVDRGNYEVDEPAGDDHGNATALLVACRLGHAPAAARLLEAGANVNKADARGETPLLAAARSGALLDSSVPDESAKSKNIKAKPTSPEHHQGKCLGELLLEAGANVDAVDSELYETALHVIAGAFSTIFVGGAKRRGEAATLLLSYGADPLRVDAFGRTPLLLACGTWPPPAVGPSTDNASRILGDAADASAVLEALLAYRPQRAFDLDFAHERLPVRTALGAAAIAGRIDAVSALLRAGAAPDAAADAQGRAALALAADAGHASVVAVLARAAPRLLEQSDINGSTALHAAAIAGQTAAVVALLAAGARAERADASGKTPLQLVSAALISRESNEDASSIRPSSFGTAVHPDRQSSIIADDRPIGEKFAAVARLLSVMRYAVAARAYDRCAELVQRGNFALTQGDGAIALSAAARDGDANALSKFYQVGGDYLIECLGSQALEACAKYRRPQAAQVLLSCGARPSVDTAAALLALAVDVGDDKLAQLLLELGADAAQPCPIYLFKLSEEQNKDLSSLRDIYARAFAPSDTIDTSDTHGLTALARAAAAPSPRGVEMLRVLLGEKSRDAKRTLLRSLTDASKGLVSPLHAAAVADCSDTLALLLRYCRDENSMILPTSDSLGGGVGGNSPATSTRSNQSTPVSHSELLNEDEKLNALDAGFAIDGSQRTPLHVAASHGNYDAAAVLITTYGVDEADRIRLLSAIDARGAAPLACAARVNDGAIVSLLLTAGADSEAFDSTNNSALDEARCARNGLAYSHARRRLEAMRVAIDDGDFDRALRLVYLGSFSVRATSGKNSILTRSAACGRGDVIDKALAYGAQRCQYETARRAVSKGIPPSPNLTDDAGLGGFAVRDLEAALAAAAICRQPAAAEALLLARADIRPRIEDAPLLLRLAVCRRRHSLIKLLLTRGAEPLAACPAALDPSTTSTKETAQLGVLPVGDTGGSKEIDSSIMSSFSKRTPFNLAVLSGDLEAVKIFTDQRYAVFDIDARDEYGTTALMEALRHGHVAVAHALLANGSDAEAKDVSGRSALEFACFDEPEKKSAIKFVRNSLDTCRALAVVDAAEEADERHRHELEKKKKQVEEEEKRRKEAEEMAVSEEQAKNENVANVEDRQDVKNTKQEKISSSQKQQRRPSLGLRSSAVAAERKALNRQVTTLEALGAAEATAKIERETAQAALDKALALAVAQRNITAVHSLLRAGANALSPCRDDKRRSDSETPLLRACRQPDLATLGALLAHVKPNGKRVLGFDIDAPHGSVKAAALAVAAASGDADACRLLLDAGADVNRCDVNGRGPIYMAASRGHANVIHLLANSCKSDHSEASVSAPPSALDHNKQERPSKALDAVDVTGATPLHAAARIGSRAVIAELLAAGADATIRDESGRTPRRVAMERNFWRAADQLDAMSAAIIDGDYAECIRLSRNGNWPLDWKVGADDDDDVVDKRPAQ